MNVDLSELIRQYPALAGIIVLFITGFVRDYFMRQSFMKAAQTIQEASIALLTPYQAQVNAQGARITDCEERLKQLEQANQRLWGGVHLLTVQIQQAGLSPIWYPRDRDRPTITKGDHLDYM